MKRMQEFLSVNESQTYYNEVGKVIKFGTIHQNQNVPENVANNLDVAQLPDPKVTLVEVQEDGAQAIAVIYSKDYLSPEEISGAVKRNYSTEAGASLNSFIPDPENPAILCGYKTPEMQFFVQPVKVVDEALSQESLSPASLADYNGNLVAALLVGLKEQSEKLASQPVVEQPLEEVAPW